MPTDNVEQNVPEHTNPECLCNEKRQNVVHPKEKFEMDMIVYNHHPWKWVENVPFDINGIGR